MKGIFNAVFYVAVGCAAVFSIFGIVPFGILILFTFYGAGQRAAKSESLVRTTLMAGENLVAQAVQKRAFALFARRAIVAITDSRILIIRRGLFGGFRMADIQWKDLKDVTIEQNVLNDYCGSNLSFAHLNAGVMRMAVDGIPSETASVIYSRAQSEEHAWEEKRRVRAMEEVRAAAGGVVVHANQGQVPVNAAPTGNRMLSEIQEAKKLLDSGTISDAEFQEMKAKILASS